MKHKFKAALLSWLLLITFKISALSNGDVSIRLISGYFWLDNTCTAGSPLGKVVSFRVKNTKGSALQGVSLNLGSIGFTATGAVTYTSGTPSFLCKTSTSFYLGNIAAGDSATAFFYVGYNCILYPNNTNITTDYITLPITVKDVNNGTVSLNFTKQIYVIRNSNNNTIAVLATTQNLVGTMLTIAVSYNISNVKPTNIIDMELSTTSSFPNGYSISGCKITSSTITTDFPVGLLNTHYSNNIASNLPSGGTVTIEWYLKINSATVGITSSNIVPFVVSDAGSAQRWQANTTSFVGTSIPANSLSVKKMVNHNSAIANDTVVYTIVIKNSSLVSDVTIDRLVDDLPRDYQFLYMQTDTHAYKHLITYSNCTSYPTYQDTNLLFFVGQKELSSGVFSWVVPKHDSIQLMYSVKVSSTPGLRDTNTIAAFIGNSAVGNALAVVNIYAPLPVKLLYLNAQQQFNGVELTWGIPIDTDPKKFVILKKNDLNDPYEMIGELRVEEGIQNSNFKFFDPSGNSSTGATIFYLLKSVDESNVIDSFMVNITLTDAKQSVRVINLHEDGLGIIGITTHAPTINITILDLNGRMVYNGECMRSGGQFQVPFNINGAGLHEFIMTIESMGKTMYKKLAFLE